MRGAAGHRKELKELPTAADHHPRPQWRLPGPGSRS